MLWRKNEGLNLAVANVFSKAFSLFPRLLKSIKMHHIKISLLCYFDQEFLDSRTVIKYALKYVPGGYLSSIDLFLMGEIIHPH